jgi:hypothetical protein
MASSKLLKEAIADAKAVRETAIANAKIALEEAFTPRLQSILSKKLTAEMEGEEEEVEVNEDNDVSSDLGKGDNKQPADKANSAQTDLSGISKQSGEAGSEVDDYDKVKDLTESEDEFDAEEEIPAEEPAMEGEEEMDNMEMESDEDELDLESKNSILVNFLDNSSNIEFLVKYFENYRLNLKNNTLNSYIKGVVKH